jgi:hypothetical protein
MDGQHLRRRLQRTAQRAADGQLVYLEDGQAPLYRARMRRGERFLCPACDIAFLTARGGNQHDHFVHPPGQPAGGHQVAVEVQYSGLTIESWRARHGDYRQRGITDVWLWRLDLSPAQIAAPEPPLVRMPAAQQAALHAGLPALWICADGQIATGYSGRPCAEEVDGRTSQWWRPATLAHTGLRLPDWPVTAVAIEPLSACTIAASGLVTPMLGRIHQERAALQAKAAPLQQQAARAERAQQAQVAAVLAERNAHKDPKKAQAFLEQTPGELHQRLPAAAYGELAHPTHADTR